MQYHKILTKLRFYCLAAVSALSLITVSAQEAEAVEGSEPSTQEVDRLADDFIKVSLITVGGADMVYNGAGHSALRLQCPTYDLDVCFSFEMEVSAQQKMLFFLGETKAGFIHAPSDAFFKIFTDVNREVRSVELNLSPLQRQQLWKLLDKEESNGLARKFDHENSSCSSMVLYALETCLGEEHIEWAPEDLNAGKSLRDYLYEELPESPWSALMLDMYTGVRGDNKQFNGNHFWPQPLYRALSRAQRKGPGEDAVGTPMLRPETETVLFAAADDSYSTPKPITPVMATIALLLLSILASVWQKHKGYDLFCRATDVVLMGIEVFFGTILLISFCSHLDDGMNFIVLTISPLPFVFWLLTWKLPKLRTMLWRLCTLVLALAIIATPWIPQFQTIPLILFYLSLLFRTTLASISKK